jgi:poly(A)-specific ribonuclease
MEVTKINFKDVLDVVSEAINEASFLAIDAEFSGLETGRAIHAFDTPQERYQKLLKAAKEYIILQFGLSAFHYNHQSEQYEARSFNFYICPRPYGKLSNDMCFKCQSSSVDFLACQGLDFGKVFRDGISYLLPAEAQKLSESLNQKHAQQAAHLSPSSSQTPTAEAVVTPGQHQPFVDKIIAQVETFLESSELKFIDLEPCNGYLRKLIYQAVKHKFGTKLLLESVSNEQHQRLIRVSVARTNEERKQMEKERQTAELQELDDAIGFSKVVQLISKSGKLVVGHNMILDLLHTVEHFVMELPEKYEEFKCLLPCIFPRILDTKYMASSDPFKDLISSTVLADMLKELEKVPFGRPQVAAVSGFTRYNTGEYLHEAGYDSLITGQCFLAMAQYLASSAKSTIKYADPDSQVIQQYTNRLHLMRMTDVSFINLSGPDAQLSRDHVFHITFPSEWKTDNIVRLFSPFGNVQIVWLNDTSAFVGLYNRDQTNAVLTSLTNVSNGMYRLLTYHQYTNMADSLQSLTPGDIITNTRLVRRPITAGSVCTTPQSISPAQGRGVKRQFRVADADVATSSSSAVKKTSRTSLGGVAGIPTIPEEDSEPTDELCRPQQQENVFESVDKPVTVDEERNGVELINELLSVHKPKTVTEKDIASNPVAKLFDEPSDW